MMRTLFAIESPRMGDNLVMQRTHHLHLDGDVLASVGPVVGASARRGQAHVVPRRKVLLVDEGEHNGKDDSKRSQRHEPAEGEVERLGLALAHSPAERHRVVCGLGGEVEGLEVGGDLSSSLAHLLSLGGAISRENLPDRLVLNGSLDEGPGATARGTMASGEAVGRNGDDG